MRSPSPRGAWADIGHFLERAAKPVLRTGDRLLITARRWSAESANGKLSAVYGDWPSDCSIADFDAAVRLAKERFGKPKPDSLKQDEFESEQIWRLPVERVEEVLAFLDDVQGCTGGEWAPVHASYWCLFHLRDLVSGKVLPEQGKRYHPLQSWLSATLQRESAATLGMILPFAEPDDAAADYVVALQEHAPVWLDPRYFDHVVPAADNSRFHRRRLPPSWIGETPSGEPRLDASRSGITPNVLDLPTDAEMAAEVAERDDAPFQTNYVAVANALRKHSMATLVIRGPVNSGKRYMVEQAAKWLELPLHVVGTFRKSKSPTLEDQLRAIVSASDGRPSLLLVEVVDQVKRATNVAVLSQMAGRVIVGVELPAGMRLVVTEDIAVGAATRAAWGRGWQARDEGFASREQLAFLDRLRARAAWREVTIEVLAL
jgi:hypothetical protein